MHELYPVDLATLGRAELEQAIHARTQTVYLGRGVVLARVLTRTKLLLHSADRGFACHVMMDGFWEIWLTRFFARVLRPGMHVVDVGANYGYYTMLFADCVTATGRVLAIEPNPQAADLLRQAVVLNGHAGNTEVMEVALGSAEGRSNLFIPEGEPKNAYLGSGIGRSGHAVEVALTTLDRAAEGLGRVDLVKIDAEGAEEGIIAGMERLLAQSPPPALLLEFNAARSGDAAGLLGRLRRTYGALREVDFDGNAVPVDADTLLTVAPGQDRLLYCAVGD